jgi:hypothetical protein
LDNQDLGDPPQLTRNNAESDQNKASYDRRRSGADERVPKAEFVDRNTKPDHHEPRKKHKGADAVQQSGHALLILS